MHVNGLFVTVADFTLYEYSIQRILVFNVFFYFFGVDFRIHHYFVVSQCFTLQRTSVFRHFADCIDAYVGLVLLLSFNLIVSPIL